MQSTSLGTLGVPPTDVLPDLIDALDDDLLTTLEHLDHRPRCRRCVVPGHDNDLIAFLDLHFGTNFELRMDFKSASDLQLVLASVERRVQTTSLARLMIFIYRRSRNSRATAPKIRVPRGFPSLSISTIAFLSKRT